MIKFSFFLSFFILLFFATSGWSNTPILLHERYQVNGPCIDLNLFIPNAPKQCLFSFPPRQSRLFLPTYRIRQALLHHGYVSQPPKSGQILFQRVSNLNLSPLKEELKKRYKSTYPTLSIQAISIKPNGDWSLLSSLDHCSILIQKNNLRSHKGFGALHCQKHRRYFFSYALDATLRVYKAKHQIKKDTILSYENLAQTTIAFWHLTDRPIVRLEDTVVAAHTIPKGRMITERMVRPLPDIRKGERVRCILKEHAVTIELEGVALKSGNRGETIPIKRHNGKVIHGKIIGQGSVEIQ